MSKSMKSCLYPEDEVARLAVDVGLPLGHELGLHAVRHALLDLHLQVVLLVDELDVGTLVAHLKMANI